MLHGRILHFLVRPKKKKLFVSGNSTLPRNLLWPFFFPPPFCPEKNSTFCIAVVPDFGTGKYHILEPVIGFTWTNFRFLFHFHFTMDQVLLNIYRQKCDHAPELCTFKVFNVATTFEKLEGRFLCHADGKMEVSLASQPEGPWTKLDDSEDSAYDMFQVPKGLLMKQVFFKFIFIIYFILTSVSQWGKIEERFL